MYPTLSITIPLYNILIDHIEDIIDNDNVIDEEVSENESNNEDEENEENET